MAVTINFTSPNGASVYLPVQILSNTGAMNVEGYITPDAGEELSDAADKPVTAWDQALDIQIEQDYHTPLDFSVSRIPTAPGKRTVKVKTPLSNNTSKNKTVDFLALPRRLRLDLTGITFTGGSCGNCGNAKRVFYLENDPVLASEVTTAPQSRTEVWTQRINPKVCKCHSIRLEVKVTQGAATGEVGLWILPTHSAIKDLRIIKYENTAWDYGFPISLTLETGGGVPTTCVGWKNSIEIQPA